ncbi:MAG: selenium-dependent molybdenum cofactor biosynthesis protein YqeB [Bacillota bacterium]
MKNLIILRGGGDIATGVAHRLRMSGFNLVLLELPCPTAIRRNVAFANAVFEVEATVEGISSRLAKSIEDVNEYIRNGIIPVIIDPEGEYISHLKPLAVIDCILAKKNIGTRLKMAPIVIGVGPGFEAGRDVHAVVESNRGHNLGKVILTGSACSDSSIPGDIGGFALERVLRAVCDGTVENRFEIGDYISSGDIVCTVDGLPVRAEISGILRGIIHNGIRVCKNMKIGDIDPRGDKSYCCTISDKARSIGGGVLEALLYLDNLRKNNAYPTVMEEYKC